MEHPITVADFPYKIMSLLESRGVLHLPDYIILDYDDTLVDSRLSYLQSFKELCDRWELSLDGNDVRKRFAEEGKKGISTSSTRRAIIRDYWPSSSRFQNHPLTNEELYPTVEEDWNEILSSQTTPVIEGAVELIKWADEKSIPVAILSGGRDDAYLKREVEKYFPSFNQTYIYGEQEEIENNKPHPGALKRVLEGFAGKLDSHSVNGWIIGDGYIDLSFAKNCNLQAVLIRSQPSGIPLDLIGGKNIYLAKNLREIIEVLGKTA